MFIDESEQSIKEWIFKAKEWIEQEFTQGSINKIS